MKQALRVVTKKTDVLPPLTDAALDEIARAGGVYERVVDELRMAKSLILQASRQMKMDRLKIDGVRAIARELSRENARLRARGF